MTFFTYEYEAKLDSKGRLILPAKIKAQLPEGSSELVVRRGFEQCLILYPMVEFKRVYSRISGLSELDPENRKLQRSFFSGTAMVDMDASGRILIAKNMIAYAQLEKDVILVGTGTKVEIWNPEIYEKYKITDPEELSNLAAKHADVRPQG
ncbi:MAG TPA: division/cell wall cluster transcriptional repressor MraZ [Cyclobacteriaceae bacterium]|nr:division/cell wall cluster transcriptional repressor MraZ [Cyclobacteriaceae bacterium]